VEGLLAAVAAERRAAMLVLDPIDPEGPVGRALRDEAARRGARPIVFLEYERAGWRRRSDGRPPETRISASDRRELRRRQRQLATRLGGELEVVDRTDDPVAWEAFLAMENTGWKAERGTALASRPADAAFYRRMCADMSAAGHLELLALEGAGEPVAMGTHLVDGDVLYSFKIAHAPEYARSSPGTQLKRRVHAAFGDRGLALADSCAAPENEHMNRLWPDRRRMQILLLPTGAPSARLLRPGLAALGGGRVVRDRVVRPLRARLSRGG